MTFRELAASIATMSEEQKDCDLTVELGITDECIPAELRICGSNHDSLDVNHPFIYVPGHANPLPITGWYF